MSETLQGIGDWWAWARQRLQTERDKVQVFLDVAGRFNTQLQQLPELRGRIGELRSVLENTPVILAHYGDLQSVVQKLEADQGALEGRGVRLASQVQSMLARVSREKASVDQVGAQGYGETAQLAGFFLIVGIGAAAVAGTGILVGWLAHESNQRKLLNEGERILDMVEAGTVTPDAGAFMLRETRRGGGLLSIGGGILGGGTSALLLVAALVLLPQLKRGR